MKGKPTYQSLKVLGVFWVIKVIYILSLIFDSNEMSWEIPIERYIFEYAESILYLAMMCVAAYEDIKCGSKQLRLVIILTILMGLVEEKLVIVLSMGIAGVLGAFFLIMVAMAVFGPTSVVFLGLIASWIGILGPIFLVLYLISSVFFGYSMYG